MQSEELHPVVELLLARMNTHPEEFMDEYLFSELEPVNHYGNGRWEAVLRAVCKNANEAELEAVNEALRPIRLNQAHEHMMDELCNGEERRRKEREAREAEERRYYALQQQAAMNQTYTTQQANALNQLSSLGPPVPGTFYETQAPIGLGLVGSIKKGLGIK